VACRDELRELPGLCRHGDRAFEGQGRRLQVLELGLDLIVESELLRQVVEERRAEGVQIDEYDAVALRVAIEGGGAQAVR